MAVENLDPLAHELVVVRLLARGPAQFGDAGALRDVDPDLRDQNSFEIEARDHGPTLTEARRSDKHALPCGLGRLVATVLLLAAFGAACTAGRRGPAPVGPLRVGTSGDYPPYSAEAGDGAFFGFDVDAARAYARDRDRPLEFVPFRWPELADRLKRGDFDVAMSGVTVRGDRLARSPMTMPVARTEAVLVVPAGTPRFDLARNGAGLRVAVNHGGHMERIARSMLPAAGIEPVDDNRSLADLLARGRVDAVVIDAAELASFYPDPDGQMPQVAAVLSRDRKAWWVTRGDPALADDLDAWIAEREADGTLPALRTRFGIEPAAAPDARTRVAELVGRRLMLMPLVAESKRRAGRPVEDPEREARVMESYLAGARAAGLDDARVAVFARAPMEAAKNVQRAVLAAEAPRRGRAASATEANAPDAGEAASPDLEAGLHPAITRIDGQILAELARSAPLGASALEIAAAIRESAPVPGLERDDVARMAVALASLPAAAVVPQSPGVSRPPAEP